MRRHAQRLAQHAVHPHAHDQARLIGLDVNVRDALPRGVGDDAVDQPDRRRVVGGVEQVLGARQGRREMAEIAIEAHRARRIRRRLGPRRIEVREQAIEGRAVHPVHREGPGEEAPQLDQGLRIGALTHRDVQHPVRIAGRQQPVPPREAVRHAGEQGAVLRQRFVGHVGHDRLFLVRAAPGDLHCGCARKAGASCGCSSSAGAGADGGGATTWSPACRSSGATGGVVPR